MFHSSVRAPLTKSFSTVKESPSAVVAFRVKLVISIAGIWLPAFGFTVMPYPVTCMAARSKEVFSDVLLLKREDPDGTLNTVITGVHVPVYRNETLIVNAWDVWRGESTT